MNQSITPRRIAFDQYSDLSKQTKVAKANLAVNTVQTGVMMHQTSIMKDMRNSLASIASVMDEVKQLQQKTLAIQQELLRRDQVQGLLEEFIYTTEKMVTEFSFGKSELASSSRYFLLQGVLETVREEGIGTPLIRGRDNKAAYEQAIAHVNELVVELKKDSEVIEALKWAKDQETKLAQEREERVEHLKIKHEELQEQLKYLETKIVPPTPLEVLIKKHFGYTKSFIKSNIPGNSTIKNFVLFAIWFMQAFTLLGFCFIYYPWIVSLAKQIDDDNNKEVHKEIDETNDTLSKVKKEMQLLQAYITLDKLAEHNKTHDALELTSSRVKNNEEIDALESSSKENVENNNMNITMEKKQEDMWSKFNIVLTLGDEWANDEGEGNWSFSTGTVVSVEFRMVEDLDELDEVLDIFEDSSEEEKEGLKNSLSKEGYVSYFAFTVTTPGENVYYFNQLTGGGGEPVVEDFYCEDELKAEIEQALDEIIKADEAPIAL